MAKNGFRVMDSDMHIIEAPDIWERHIEPAFRDRAPGKGAGEGYTGSRWIFEGRPFPALSANPERRRLNELRTERAREGDKGARFAEARARGYDAASQLAAMDVEGIDVAISFRTLASHFIAVDGLEPALSAAVCRAFNRWLFERAQADPRRLKLAALVPPQDINLAVAEAHFAVRELGAVGLVLPSHPVEGRNLYHPAYDPLWEAAQELDVALAFHGMHAAYQEHIATRYPDNLTLAHAAAQPLELTLALGSLILGGVLERFPRLRVGLLEGTCGWLPWWLWRIDEEWEKFGAGERVQLQLAPSEYFRRQCFIAVDPDEALVTGVIGAVGDDSIVISTDWPHDDSAYPHAIEHFLALPDLSDASRRKILWDNCARLYGLAA
jgi:predicted TIM-barrel fold metal-dependent hydrolase